MAQRSARPRTGRGRPTGTDPRSPSSARRVPACRATRRAASAALLAAPFAAILVVLAPYLWPLDHGPTSRRNDIHTYHAPNVHFLASSLREDGELPRWNPQDFAGMPIVADPQAGVYNPVNWLLALRPAPNSFGLLIVVSALLGAFGFVRLARALGCSPAGAAAGATAFVLGGKALLHLVELGHVVMAPFFLSPWVLLGFERCVERPSAGRIVCATWVLAAMVVWMHPQLLVYMASFLAAAGGLAAWRSRRALRGLSALALVATGAAALTAVHLLPSLLLLTEFARTLPGLQAPAPPIPMQPGAARWLEVATGAARSVEARYYLGGITLFLALLPLLSGAPGARARALLWFHAGTALALLVYGLGEFVDPAVARGLFRHPMRALIVVGLPCAVLVAFGTDALLRTPASRRRAATGAAAAAAFGCLIAAEASAWQLGTLAVAVAAALALGESAGGLRSHQGLRLPASIAALVLVVALGFDTGTVLSPRVRTAPESEIGRWPPRLQLPRDLTAESRIAEPRRHVVIRGIPELEKRRLGLQTLTGYNPLIPWRFLVYTAYASGYDPTSFNASTTSVRVRRARPAVFDLFGVTHFLYAPLRAGGSWKWIHAREALPRAYLVPEPLVVPEGTGDALIPLELQALSRLPTLDPRRQAILHGERAAAALEAIGAARGIALEPFRAIPVLRRRAHRISLEFVTTRPAVLVITEPFFPGWRARDAGVEIPVLRANGLSRALALRPGPHRIELEFSPDSWRVGRWISLVALAASVLALLPYRRRAT